MGTAAVLGLLGAFVSFPGLLLGLLLVGIGYMLRKYVEKTWPNEAALLDAVATRYGEEAQAKLGEFKDKIKGV